MITDARGHPVEVAVCPVGVTASPPSPYDVYGEAGPPMYGEGVPLVYAEGGPPRGLQDEGQGPQAGVGTSQQAVDSRGYPVEVRAVDDLLQEGRTALFRKSNQTTGTRQQVVDSRGYPMEVRAGDGDHAVRDIHGTLLDAGLQDEGRGPHAIEIGAMVGGLQDASLHLRHNRAGTPTARQQASRDDGSWLLGQRAVYCREVSAVALSLLDAAPYPRTDSAAVRAALLTCCASTKWVDHMLRSMPFEKAANLFDAAELGWWVSSAG